MNGTFANGSFFEGQATVGLQNDTWGQIKFGNMGSAEISQYSGDVDPQQTKKYAIGTLVRGRIFSQAANGAEYLSPTIAGFTLQGQYDLTNSPTWNAGNPGSAPGQLGTSSGLGSSQGRSDGIKLSYANKGLFWQATESTSALAWRRLRIGKYSAWRSSTGLISWKTPGLRHPSYGEKIVLFLSR